MGNTIINTIPNKSIIVESNWGILVKVVEKACVSNKKYYIYKTLVRPTIELKTNSLFK